MLVGEEEGFWKSEVSFLVAIIHVKDKSPVNEAFILFMVTLWLHHSVNPLIAMLTSES